MGSKPWLKVGSVFLAGMLLCGCQDPPRQNSGLMKVPPPDPAKITTGSGLNGPSNAPPNGWAATNGMAAKPVTTGTSNFSSGVGSVGGLPAQPSAGFNSNANTFNSPAPAFPSNPSTPLPPTNTSGFGSPASSGSSNFAVGAPSSPGVGGLTSPLPPVANTGPGLPPPGGFGSAPPSSFSPSPAIPTPLR